MSGAKILAFAGSLREGSLNKKLLALAVEGAREADAEVTVIDLRDYPMPIYDGDLEASDGIPENARRIHALLEANDGLLVATPENNYSLSAVLKNTIDWVSRPVDDHPTAPLFSWQDGGNGLRGRHSRREDWNGTPPEYFRRVPNYGDSGAVRHCLRLQRG